MLGFKIHTFIGSEFTMDNLKDFLVENQDSSNLHILFIDEIHDLGVDRKKFNPTFLYPVLEDFILPMGKNPRLKKFIFIGATTDKEKIEIKYAPLLDRCTSIDLDRYNAEDIKKILKQYNSQTYKVELNEMFYDILSVNSRFNPRLSLAMFDDFVASKFDIDRILKAHRIVKDSLTTDDILILRHLEQVGKPVGVETLAVIIQRTAKNYTTLIEPFLVCQGYVSRTSKGRILMEKGKLLLQEIK
jgi:Holliday junction DNA helicase RuvB